MNKMPDPPAVEPICVACVGDGFNPDGGPCLRCHGTGVDPDPAAPVGAAPARMSRGYHLVMLAINAGAAVAAVLALTGVIR